MSSVVIAGDTSGSITLQAPAIAGSNTITLPASTGYLFVTPTAGTLGTSSGGTGLTSFTSGGAMYATSTSALTTGTLPVTAGGTGVTTSTGSGANVLGTGPTLTNATITTASTGITFSDSSAQTAAASPYVLKNRIINGDMRIAQRGTGAVNNLATDAYQGIDRWSTYGNSADKYSTQQSTTAPTGFTNSMLITSLAATSVGTGGLYLGIQYVEGFNAADLAWGTASAKTVTLSFWVRSSLTGTFGGSILNNARDRCYIFSYTISAANTWEQKTITITGDTSGTWLTNNGRGIGLYFSFGTGSSLSGTAGSWGSSELYAPTGATSVVGTNGATFYITGVQLEIGSTATPFERRLYNQELANCQRYYQVIGGVNGGFPMATSYFSATSQTARFPISFPVVTRATPTVTKNGTWGGNASQPSVGYISSAGFAMELNSSGSGMQYSFPDSTDDTFTIAAEL